MKKRGSEDTLQSRNKTVGAEGWLIKTVVQSLLRDRERLLLMKNMHDVERLLLKKNVRGVDLAVSP